MNQGVLSAGAALERLKEGNRRFVANVRSVDSLLSQLQRGDVTTPQRPFAIVLGCSDSRAPAEIVFDQGVGDLFVIRVAGNIVAPSQVGSVEFAVERFGTERVVVMGHSHCGAIQATVEALENKGGAPSRNLLSIVNRIRPAVEELLHGPGGQDPVSLVQAAVRANVRASVSQLRHGSEILEALVQQGKLTVLGAEYRLETGAVEFFVEPSEGRAQQQS
jgi:carbonic anhydrase